jgi:hypothetical protein
MTTFKDLLKTDKTGKVKGYCRVPWQELLIDDNGNIFNCGCSGKVKTNIGNILSIETTDELQYLFSNNTFKDSILDGSYRYCKANVCNYLQNQMLNEDGEFFTQKKEELISKLRFLYFQIDNSCNLQCPSCRNQKIIHKNDEQTSRIRNILDKVDQLILPDSENLIIRAMGNGELFASHTVSSWFLNFNFKKYPIKFFLHTNATLLHKHKDYLISIARYITGFEVSVDAATKDTYERTRVNGKWEDLLSGLQTIREMRAVNPWMTLSLSFTISDKNYMDVGLFPDFTLDQGASSSIFYKVQRWGHFTEDKWQLANIFSPTHPLHNNLITALKDVNFKQSTIHNYFEYLL